MQFFKRIAVIKIMDKAPLLPGTEGWPLSTLMVTLIFLFPIGMASVRHWSSLAFYLFAAIALCTARRWRWPTGDPRLIILAFMAFFAAAVLSLVNAQDMASGIRRLEKLVAFLLFIPMYLGARQLRVNLVTPLLAGSFLAAPVMAGVAVVEVMVKKAPRAQGFYHPIVFGDLAMLLALVFIAAWPLWANRGVWLRIGGFFAIACALYASLLSGTKGAWLALPVGTIIILLMYRQYWRNPRRIWLGLFLCLALLATSPLLFPKTVGQRVGIMVRDLQDYAEGEKRNSSTGQRLLMWQLALDVWLENPVLGTGLGDYSYEVATRMESGETEMNIVRGHAHNIFFDSLSTTGLVGLIGMIMALFVLPLRAFLRHVRTKETEVVAVGGIIVVAAFMIFGLTEGWLARSPFVRSYLFFLLAFLTALPQGEGNG
jgi:O-antigen ligase